MSMRRWMMVGGAGVTMLALLGMATWAEAHVGDGITNAIHACVATKDGAVRIVGPTGSCNANKETAAHWSIQGPAGVLGSFDDLEGLACTTAPGTAGTAKLFGDLKSPVCAVAVSTNGRFLDLGPVVVDTQTNLMWEKKVAGSGCLHCVDDVYTWGDATGTWITQVNGAGFAGHSGWRVPTKDELLGIVDTGVTGCGSGTPCIDPIFGPTVFFPLYWSSTEVDALHAWFVNFFNGGAGIGIKSGPVHVRAVRGGS